MDIISYSQATKAKREWQKVEKRIGKDVIGTHANAHLRINAIQSQANSLSQGVLSEITERNIISQMRRTLRLGSLQASTQHKMHQMIIEYLKDDSAIDHSKSSNITVTDGKIAPTTASNFTMVTQPEAVGKVKHFMWQGGLRGTTTKRDIALTYAACTKLEGLKEVGKSLVKTQNPYYLLYTNLELPEDTVTIQHIVYDSAKIVSVEWLDNKQVWQTAASNQIIQYEGKYLSLRVTPILQNDACTISDIKLTLHTTIKESTTTSNITLSTGTHHNTEWVSNQLRLKKDEAASTSQQVMYYESGHWTSLPIDREVLGIHKYLTYLLPVSSTTGKKQIAIREGSTEEELAVAPYKEVQETGKTPILHKRYYQLRVTLFAGMGEVKTQFSNLIDTLEHIKKEGNLLKSHTIEKGYVTQESNLLDAEDNELRVFALPTKDWLRIDKVR